MREPTPDAAVAAVRARFERLATAELECALARLGHLAPQDRAVVAWLSQRLVETVIHDLIAQAGSLATCDALSKQVSMRVLARLLADPAERGAG